MAFEQTRKEGKGRAAWLSIGRAFQADNPAYRPYGGSVPGVRTEQQENSVVAAE